MCIVQNDSQEESVSDWLNAWAVPRSLSLFSEQGLSPKQSDFLSTLASVISVNKVILCVLLKNSFTFKYAKHFYLSK